MPLARIRTPFSEEVQELCEALIDAGYVVETARPGEFRITPADLELAVDKLPVIEAWRNIPDADVVYVAPGTPESRDIRSSAGRRISHGSLLAAVILNCGETAIDISHWFARQWREARSRVHEWRERWTPPREYHASPKLEPAAPPTDPDVPIQFAVARAKREQEDRRRALEAAARELAMRAQQEADARRRAREAAEAKARVERQQNIEAMVRSSEQLRDRVLHYEDRAPRKPKRRAPRRILRTQRERAFVRAGITAFSLSLVLAFLGAQALHPRPASAVLPKTTAAQAVPFARPAATALGVPESQPEPARPSSAMPAFSKDTALGAAVMTADAKPLRSKRGSEAAGDDVEVIVRKSAEHPRAAKPKSSVVHYSDLD